MVVVVAVEGVEDANGVVGHGTPMMLAALRRPRGLNVRCVLSRCSRCCGAKENAGDLPMMQPALRRQGRAVAGGWGRWVVFRCGDRVDSLCDPKPGRFSRFSRFCFYSG